MATVQRHRAAAAYLGRGLGLADTGAGASFLADQHVDGRCVGVEAAALALAVRPCVVQLLQLALRTCLSLSTARLLLHRPRGRRFLVCTLLLAPASLCHSGVVDGRAGTPPRPPPQHHLVQLREGAGADAVLQHGAHVHALRCGELQRLQRDPQEQRALGARRVDEAELLGAEQRQLTRPCPRRAVVITIVAITVITSPTCEFRHEGAVTSTAAGIATRTTTAGECGVALALQEPAQDGSAVRRLQHLDLHDGPLAPHHLREVLVAALFLLLAPRRRRVHGLREEERRAGLVVLAAGRHVRGRGRSANNHPHVGREVQGQPL